MASQRTNQVGLGRMVTLRVDTCIMFAIEEPLETQSNVQDEEENRNERNRNYKRESQAWLATIDGNVKAYCFQGLDQHNQQVMLNVTSYAITMGRHG